MQWFFCRAPPGEGKAREARRVAARSAGWSVPGEILSAAKTRESSRLAHGRNRQAAAASAPDAPCPTGGARRGALGGTATANYRTGTDHRGAAKTKTQKQTQKIEQEQRFCSI